MIRTLTQNSIIIITKYTCYHRRRKNIPNYWRAAITAAPEVRFEGAKEKTQML